MNTLEIVGAERLDDLATLESVAEAVFGRGDRQPGWFRRKLIREGVDPRLSSLVVPADQRVEPASVQGYALLGRAASLGGIARGAGVGVLAPLRGRGIGRQLVEHALARAGAAGCDAVEFLAEPDRLAWYLDQGFATVEEQVTLLGSGLGELDAALPEPSEPPSMSEDPAWSWIPEIWARTPADERRFTVCDGVRLWLTREGRAWLVHRCELEHSSARASSSLVRGLTTLRRAIPRGTPLLLYPFPAASAWLEPLREAGFAPVQRSFVVCRHTKATR